MFQTPAPEYNTLSIVPSSNSAQKLVQNSKQVPNEKTATIEPFIEPRKEKKPIPVFEPPFLVLRKDSSLSSQNSKALCTASHSLLQAHPTEPAIVAGNVDSKPAKSTRLLKASMAGNSTNVLQVAGIPK